MCTETEVYFWQTTAENSLVVTVDLSVAIDIAIEAVTYLCTWLVFVETLCLSQGIQLVELALCADDALIIPTIELTNLLANLCDV